jgi:hypothetical protein
MGGHANRVGTPAPCADASIGPFDVHTTSNRPTVPRARERGQQEELAALRLKVDDLERRLERRWNASDREAPTRIELVYTALQAAA